MVWGRVGVVLVILFFNVRSLLTSHVWVGLYCLACRALEVYCMSDVMTVLFDDKDDGTSRT